MIIFLVFMFIATVVYFVYVLARYVRLSSIVVGKTVPFNHSRRWETVDIKKSVDTAMEGIDKFLQVD